MIVLPEGATSNEDNMTVDAPPKYLARPKKRYFLNLLVFAFSLLAQTGLPVYGLLPYLWTRKDPIPGIGSKWYVEMLLVEENQAVFYGDGAGLNTVHIIEIKGRSEQPGYIILWPNDRLSATFDLTLTWRVGNRFGLLPMPAGSLARRNTINIGIVKVFFSIRMSSDLPCIFAQAGTIGYDYASSEFRQKQKAASTRATVSVLSITNVKKPV